MPDLKSLKPTEILDLVGKDCPYHIILTKNTMENLPSGAILKILTDTLVTVEESIPRYCEKHGYQFETVKVKDYWEIYIQKA